MVMKFISNKRKKKIVYNVWEIVFVLNPKLCVEMYVIPHQSMCRKVVSYNHVTPYPVLLLSFCMVVQLKLTNLKIIHQTQGQGEGCVTCYLRNKTLPLVYCQVIGKINTRQTVAYLLFWLIDTLIQYQFSQNFKWLRNIKFNH